MYARIVTFSLNGTTDEDYRNQATGIADMFNTWTGLHAKLWLANDTENRYGGVYLFRSAAAADDSRSSPLFQAMIADPTFTNLSIDEFEILDAPSSISAPRLLEACATAI